MEAEDWDRRYADAELLWSADPNRFVARELRELTPGCALDLGAGEGRNAIWLAEHGWHVDAVDFSRVGLERARRIAEQRRVRGVKWIDADLRHYTPESWSYDLVLLAYLHLPWTSMRRVLHRAAEAVRGGGLLLLIGHDRSNLEHGYGGPPDPTVLYSPEDVSAELPGLEVVKAEHVMRPVETEHGTVHAIDNLVRALRPVRPHAHGPGSRNHEQRDSVPC